MSTKQQHTPGPWGIDSMGFVCWSRQSDYCRSEGGIAKMVGNSQDWEQDANARLIAAAPELLDALRGLLHAFAEAIDHEPAYMCIGDEARAAIAKATGGEA